MAELGESTVEEKEGFNAPKKKTSKFVRKRFHHSKGTIRKNSSLFFSSSWLIPKLGGSETRAWHSAQEQPVDKHLEKGG